MPDEIKQLFAQYQWLMQQGKEAVKERKAAAGR
jgi:hypothetical protein